jgi:hypothetical protein
VLLPLELLDHRLALVLLLLECLRYFRLLLQGLLPAFLLLLRTLPVEVVFSRLGDLLALLEVETRLLDGHLLFALGADHLEATLLLDSLGLRLLLSALRLEVAHAPLVFEPLLLALALNF